MTRFTRLQLRTTDVSAAQAFYAEVFGDADLDVVPLPEMAAAAGAPSHWLGHLGVDDVEGVATAFVGYGATRLGPTRPGPDGETVALLRDPGGAVVALASGLHESPSPEVAWYQLSTLDLPRTMAAYCNILGWAKTDSIDVGDVGPHQRFAWKAGSSSAGSMVDIAGHRGRHPHWLFHFRVASMDGALAAVRAAGGVVVQSTERSTGVRVAVCDDPQGAAFALRGDARRR